MFKTAMELNEFRKKLYEIINNEIVSRQPTLIDKLSFQYLHSITLLSHRFFIDATKDCFKYIFEDKIPKIIWQIIEKKHRESNEDSEAFISELISEGFLNLHDKQEVNGKIVVYFKGDKVKHFAKINNDKYTSKWGNGHEWSHGLWEIPLSYGDRTEYSTDRIDISVLKKVLKIQ